MKIIGGTFGPKGSAAIYGGVLNIAAAKKACYRHDQVAEVSYSTASEKKFGILGALIGAVLLAILFGLFLGGLGILIGIGLAIAGSFYTDKQETAEILFDDGNRVMVECTPRAVKKLMDFKVA